MVTAVDLLNIAIANVTAAQIKEALDAASDEEIEREFESRGLGESYYETAFDEAYDSVDKAAAMIRSGDVDGGLLFIERMVRPKFGDASFCKTLYEKAMRVN